MLFSFLVHFFLLLSRLVRYCRKRATLGFYGKRLHFIGSELENIKKERACFLCSTENVILACSSAICLRKDIY